MITLFPKIKDRDFKILVPETKEEASEVINYINEESRFAACDTETTGLDIFNDGYRVRTVQLFFGENAYVIPTHLYNDWQWLRNHQLIFQNAAFDVLSIEQSLGVVLDWDKLWDTKILAHLVDPRGEADGGPGLSLQALTAHYIDEDVAKDIKGSMTTMAKKLGITKGELFKTIDVFDEDYLTYAGMDVILTYALYNILMPLIPDYSRWLIRREHKIAEVCTAMERNGFLLNVEYAQSLSEKLLEEQEAWEAYALVEYGVESVNSNAEVAEALVEDGVKLTKKTASGAFKVDKTILEPLAEEGHMLAVAVIQAKALKKQRATWVDTFLENKDPNDRCHPFIHPLQARTGRMSITGIPAQTLPSSDYVVRDCFIADPGQVIVSCDYQAQELRVLAALSGDKNMLEAFRNDADLHQMTADASGVERSVGKTVNFAYVYGSGPYNIASTCNISVPKAKQVIAGFEKTYPKVKQYNQHLMKQAENQGYIVTPYGRRLPVDNDRPYAALNYMVQSTSRDVTCDGLINLFEAGFGPYLRLPIHDEVIASIPEEHAEQGAIMIANLMRKELSDIIVDTDHQVYGKSWGDGYK